MFADNYLLSEKVGFLVIELDRHLLLPVIMNLQHMVRYVHFAFTGSNEWKINFEIERPATDTDWHKKKKSEIQDFYMYLYFNLCLKFNEILLFVVLICILQKWF